MKQKNTFITTRPPLKEILEDLRHKENDLGQKLKSTKGKEEY